MYDTDEQKARWKADRPHLPLPIVDGEISSMMLDMLISEDTFPIREGRGDHDLWDMSQPRLSRFFLPPFQRPVVWDEQRMVRFVESAYLGISLGTIAYNNGHDFPTKNGRFVHTDNWLIDGQQRVTSIMRYVNDEFPIFVGTENEHRWSDLSVVEQRYFGHRQIGLIRLRSDNEDYLRLVYDLMNFGGVAHTEEQRALPAAAIGDTADDIEAKIRTMLARDPEYVLNGIPDEIIEAGCDAREEINRDLDNYVGGETTDWDESMTSVHIFRSMLARAFPSLAPKADKG
ncbi:DUF262 domain-containing protein [Erythrobacter aureus]|uniref:DUF262 domain-containing protein n=1 Tax=Erythrobacter aureus TaxID=2182384 RepID=A0A345YJ21_9SPHN|nr:DUF262 domain-containing protein [Erythrobacter aureus]AXK43923.1 DUF262 domain-containing protein [Erythrobacter aureus]